MGVSDLNLEEGIWAKKRWPSKKAGMERGVKHHRDCTENEMVGAL